MTIDFSTLPRHVVIVGSRTFTQMHWVKAFVDRLKPDTVVMSGGAVGVDEAAEIAAKKRGLEVDIYLPDWKGQGVNAGKFRNFALVLQGVDRKALWVAFPSTTNGRMSDGTFHGLQLAHKHQLTCLTFPHEGQKQHAGKIPRSCDERNALIYKTQEVLKAHGISI